MTTMIREFKMVVTERANLEPTSNQSVSTTSTSGRASFTIQIPASSDVATSAAGALANTLQEDALTMEPLQTPTNLAGIIAHIDTLLLRRKAWIHQDDLRLIRDWLKRLCG